MALIVMKFGGTSVGSAERIEAAAQIVAKRAATDKVVVVVSAMSGVTDMLLKAAGFAASRQINIAQQQILAIQHAHAGVVAGLGLGAESSGLAAEVQALEGELQSFVQSVGILGEVTPRTQDYISSIGERVSCRLMAVALRKLGQQAEPVDASRFLITNDQFGNAFPLLDRSKAPARDILSPMVADGVIPVVTGFIGATEDGYVTTLGRGGSDYSASIVGRLLGADEVIIWTDVDGVMTANPRVVPDARTLPRISYLEAAELSYFGAKVLHPKTIAPAVEDGIPVSIRNTFRPEGAGTLIGPDVVTDGAAVRAITSISKLALLTVQGKGMIGLPGVAARVFSTVAQENISVMMISQSSSEYNICLMIEALFGRKAYTALSRTFEREIDQELIEGIKVQDGVSIVAVIGSGMRGRPDVAGRVFTVLGREGIEVLAIAQGSSELNLSFVIASKDEDSAVRSLHADLIIGSGAVSDAAKIG